MLRLLYITNDEKIALTAEKAGVDWIFIDLEVKGKEQRQKGRNTVISAHSINDIKKIKKVLTTSKVMVRINPIGEWSREEIDNVVNAGADIIMLPYFKTVIEVDKFLHFIDKRVESCLLVETMDSVKEINTIVNLDGIDYIHIGLNDIHIERKTDFMFEFLADGYIDELAKNIKAKKIPFGFGGVAYMESELLPLAKDVIAEHYRVGSSGVILARSFIDSSSIENYEEFESEFISKVKSLRELEKRLVAKDVEFFKQNKKIVRQDTYKVRDIIRKNRKGNS